MTVKESAETVITEMSAASLEFTIVADNILSSRGSDESNHFWTISQLRRHEHPMVNMSCFISWSNTQDSV